MSIQYEIHAVRYAQQMRKSSANFLGGDPHDVDMPLNYFVWVIRNSERTIMVDTGFDPATAARRGRVIERPVEEGLRALGVDPDAVEDVILTHMHYDHAGNHGLSPAARFHLQEREMAFATGPCMCHKGMRVAFEADHVVAFVRKVFEDKVSFCSGTSQEVAPGIEVHHVGGHTAGLQVVRVATPAGWVVLGSMPATSTRIRSSITISTCCKALRSYVNSPLPRSTSFPDTIPWCSSAIPPHFPAAMA